VDRVTGSARPGGLRHGQIYRRADYRPAGHSLSQKQARSRFKLIIDVLGADHKDPSPMWRGVQALGYEASGIAC
jgi:hypothetical protein